MSDRPHQPNVARDFFDGFALTAPDGAYLSVYGDGFNVEFGVFRASGSRLARQLRLAHSTMIGKLPGYKRDDPDRPWAPRESHEKGERYGRRLAEALASGATHVVD
jgi:hypothetical protein